MGHPDFLQFFHSFFINFNIAERSGIGLMTGGDERVRGEAVKRRKDDDQVGMSSRRAAKAWAATGPKSRLRAGL